MEWEESVGGGMSGKLFLVLLVAKGKQTGNKKIIFFIQPGLSKTGLFNFLFAFLSGMEFSLSAAEAARRTPYNFSIPRLCFHPTDLFPDRGDPIDHHKALMAAGLCGGAGVNGQGFDAPFNADSPHNTRHPQSASSLSQPQFRVVVGPRLWDFMTVVQFVGFNDISIPTITANNTTIGPTASTNTSNVNTNIATNSNATANNDNPTNTSIATNPTTTTTSQSSPKLLPRLRSRHVMLFGAPGSGKSTVMMTAAAFMTYRTMTNIYRVAAIGDARAWAQSGDPFMYFALEMLVALRDYHSGAGEKRAHFLHPEDTEDEEGEESRVREIQDEEEAFPEEETAGFLVEPRALTCIEDVRQWILAIRDCLRSMAATGLNQPISISKPSHPVLPDLRIKLILMIDQAEYILERPDSIPAQIVQCLMELEDEDDVAVGSITGVDDTCKFRASYLPSLVLSVRSSVRMPAWLDDLVDRGICLTHALPARLDPAMSERVTRLALRRSLPFLSSFWHRSIGQWERDVLQSGEVRAWTGARASEIARFFQRSAPHVLKTASCPNRLMAILEAYQRDTEAAVIAQVRASPERALLLELLPKMALHLPLLHPQSFLSKDPATAAHLFLPLELQWRTMPLAMVPASNPEHASTAINTLPYTLRSLPTLQTLFSSREGCIRLASIPTAISFAVHSALLSPHVLSLLSPSDSFLFWKLFDKTASEMFLRGCKEGVKRTWSFYLRTRLMHDPRWSRITLSGRNALDDPVRLVLDRSTTRCMYFSGTVACPAHCSEAMARANVDSTSVPPSIIKYLVFCPTRFDYPYFDCFVWDCERQCAHALTCYPSIGNANGNNSGSAANVRVFDIMHSEDGVGALGGSGSGGVLTPQSLLTAWQESLTEWLTFAAEPEALDSSIRAYEDLFLGHSPSPSGTASTSGSTSPLKAGGGMRKFNNSKAGGNVAASSAAKKKKKPLAIVVKTLWLNDLAAVAADSGFDLVFSSSS